ncbi:DUF3261 domain-containing protein [Thalassospira alkalitolerans]|uniref:DUF3261 domain-containing protein n=1 Tax=Thalassospira alkalitolerans TaxID=1293890 RepID=UPI0030ED5227|tara:strand:- start:58714 stop:59352 length:639 start_codon:yes stop_codon:yes gene_type:complete
MRAIIIRTLFASILAAGLTACDSIHMPEMSMPNIFAPGQTQTVMLDPGSEFTLPDEPWDSDETIDVTQQVRANWKDGTETGQGIFQARITIERDHARIIMLDDLGRRAIDIDWTVDALSVQSADWLPASLDAKRLLADIIMVYWPKDVLEGSLPDNMSVNQTMGERIIRLNNNGRAYARIERPVRDVWHGVATLRNEQFGYVITINSKRTGS